MGIRSIALENIERKSEWVRGDAESVASYVRMLARLPDYETNAEDAITRAENALTEALLSVKLSRSELQRKRREHLAAAE